MNRWFSLQKFVTSDVDGWTLRTIWTIKLHMCSFSALISGLVNFIEFTFNYFTFQLQPLRLLSLTKWNALWDTQSNHAHTRKPELYVSAGQIYSNWDSKKGRTEESTLWEMTNREGKVSPRQVCVTSQDRKWILFNGIFGSRGQRCYIMGDWQPVFCSPCKTTFTSPFIAHHPPFVSFPIFTWCYFLPFTRVCFPSLFLSALRLCYQRFTLDIQLLVGHGVVIPFRAALFSAASPAAIQITFWAAFGVAVRRNVVFKHSWGHRLIWSHGYNWMSVVT